jgi:hypothetical protein
VVTSTLQEVAMTAPDSTTPDGERADEDQGPVVPAGDDVRPGPDDTEQPAAGTTEPPD